MDYSDKDAVRAYKREWARVKDASLTEAERAAKNEKRRLRRGKKPREKAEGPCSTGGCTAVVWCKRLCRTHYFTAYSVKTRPKGLIARREWRAANREKDRASKRKNAKHNPDQRVVFGANRRAKKSGAPGAFTKSDRKALLEMAGNRCERCGATERLSVDHIVAIENGGSNWPCNLQILCRACNSSKGHWRTEVWIDGQLVGRR